MFLAGQWMLNISCLKGRQTFPAEKSQFRYFRVHCIWSVISDTNPPVQKNIYIYHLESAASGESTLVAYLVNIERLTIPRLIGIWLLGVSKMWLSGAVPGFHYRAQHICSGAQGMAQASLCIIGRSLGTKADVPRDTVLSLTSPHIIVSYFWPQNIFSSYSWQWPCQYAFRKKQCNP